MSLPIEPRRRPANWYLVRPARPLAAALLLVGGPLLGLLFGSLVMAALAFGFGAVQLGLSQLWASENRGGRLVGFTLVLVGAFTVVDGSIWMLSGAGL